MCGSCGGCQLCQNTEAQCLPPDRDTLAAFPVGAPFSARCRRSSGCVFSGAAEAHRGPTEGSRSPAFEPRRRASAHRPFHEPGATPPSDRPAAGTSNLQTLKEALLYFGSRGLGRGGAAWSFQDLESELAGCGGLFFQAGGTHGRSGVALPRAEWGGEPGGGAQIWGRRPRAWRLGVGHQEEGRRAQGRPEVPESGRFTHSSDQGQSSEHLYLPHR